MRSHRLLRDEPEDSYVLPVATSPFVEVGIDGHNIGGIGYFP
jgi:hypothetical protein